jgi:dimethylaniline monooxygenase (N-oxide forming)
MRIAIVGAGISGLVTAKVLAQSGHDVSVFERRNGLGGVWERSRHYAGLKIQSPREIYVFSDFPMPADYPEFPAAEQIVRYLESYAAHFDLTRLIHFGARVESLQRRTNRHGWLLRWSNRATDASEQEEFDHVVICNGLFDRPLAVDNPGRAEFESAGGQVLHSSEFLDTGVAADKTVAVVGFGKSALDIAYASLPLAARVTIVCRRTTWHMPLKLFGFIKVKDLAYSRAAEFWFGRKATGVEGFVHRHAQPLVRLYWWWSELLFGVHTGLRQRRFRPPYSMRQSVGLATGAGFADNLRALREGRIGFARGGLARLSRSGLQLDTGQTVPAQLVVLATGFTPDVSLLPPEDQNRLVKADGDFRLFRHIVNPDLPDLSFNGYNGTTAVPVTSEVAAHWIAAWLAGRIAPPTREQMNRSIEDDLAWRHQHMPASDRFGHFAGPFTFGYLDTLLADMGLPPADAGRPGLRRFNAILNPADYAFLNSR